jgi:hypothetical protein
MDKRNVIVRNTARWTILLVALLVAAIYLNSALFSVWVAGGPPTPYPEAWAHRALVHACTAGALVLAGIAAFRGIGAFPRIGSIPLLLGLAALAVLAFPRFREFLLIDSCLDSGGRWEEAAFQCVR